MQSIPPTTADKQTQAQKSRAERYDVSPITIIQAQGEYLFKYLIIIITIIGQPTLYSSSSYYDLI